MLSVLVVFSVEFTFQRGVLELIKKDSYKQIDICLEKNKQNRESLLENYKTLIKNKNNELKLYESFFNDIELKERTNKCLIDYIHSRNDTAQKNISSYLYTILTLLIILTFSSFMSILKRFLNKG